MFHKCHVILFFYFPLLLLSQLHLYVSDHAGYSACLVNGTPKTSTSKLPGKTAVYKTA